MEIDRKHKIIFTIEEVGEDRASVIRFYHLNNGKLFKTIRSDIEFSDGKKNCNSAFIKISSNEEFLFLHRECYSSSGRIGIWLKGQLPPDYSQEFNTISIYNLKTKVEVEKIEVGKTVREIELGGIKLRSKSFDWGDFSLGEETVAITYGGYMKLLNLNTGKIKHAFVGDTSNPIFSPDGQNLISGNSREIRVWRVPK